MIKHNCGSEVCIFNRERICTRVEFLPDPFDKDTNNELGLACPLFEDKYAVRRLFLDLYEDSFDLFNNPTLTSASDDARRDLLAVAKRLDDNIINDAEKVLTQFSADQLKELYERLVDMRPHGFKS